MDGFKQWIAIVEPQSDPRSGTVGSWLTLPAADRARVLATPGLTGLDVRLDRPGAALVARECVEAGKPYRVHSWVGRHDGTRSTIDAAEAERQAVRVTTQIRELARAAGAPPESYGANAERDWWAGNPRAVDALDAFAVRFRAEDHATALDYLGFPLPSWHYGRVDWDHDGDLDTVVPPSTQGHFRRLLCMAYQTTWKDLASTLERARAAWPTRPMGAFVGVGALVQDGTTVGDPEAIQRAAEWRAGGIDELTHYVGLGRSRACMLTQGNALVDPLTARIPEIARVTSRGAA